MKSVFLTGLFFICVVSCSQNSPTDPEADPIFNSRQVPQLKLVKLNESLSKKSGSNIDSGELRATKTLSYILMNTGDIRSRCGLYES